jgi:hypothetical protein
MHFPELFKVLRLGSAVAFHVLLQVGFIAETARTKWALVEIVYVAFLAAFLVHHLTIFTAAECFVLISQSPNKEFA